MVLKSMTEFSLEELMVRDAMIDDDPVERHIILHLQRLRHQNKRLNDHIQKAGVWVNQMDVEFWKPFHFYHYFCNKYQERYSTEYRQSGNIVLGYQKIDEFRMQNQIAKKDYKQFIDLAFEKYFNKVNLPRISHICSVRLYNHLMKPSKMVSSEDFYKLDKDLMQENTRFEEYIARFNQHLV